MKARDRSGDAEGERGSAAPCQTDEQTCVGEESSSPANPALRLKSARFLGSGQFVQQQRHRYGSEAAGVVLHP